MKTIHISKIDSAGIVSEAKAAGCETVTLLGTYDHPDHPAGAWSIRLYEVNGVRVIDTNGDPIWEEDDPYLFARELEEYGIEVDK